MKEDFSQMMTPFDLSVSSRSLQMTKFLIPFLPPQTQKLVAIYVKFIEFQNALNTFQSFSKSTDDLLDEVKNMIPSSMMESYENMMAMMSMMDMFQDLNNEQKEGDFHDGLVK